MLIDWEKILCMPNNLPLPHLTLRIFSTFSSLRFFDLEPTLKELGSYILLQIKNSESFYNVT